MATCSRSGGFGGLAEAGHHLVVDPGRLLRPAQLAEPDALVDQRLGDLLAQRGFGGLAEAGHHLVVDRHLLLRLAQLAEPVTPLLTSALATCSRSGGFGGLAEAGHHLVVDRRLLRLAQLAEP